MLTEGCFAAPVPEALRAIGLTLTAASIDEFNGPDNQQHLMEVGALSLAEFWETLTGMVDDVTFDWYMSVYNEPHILVGVRDVALNPWLKTELAKIAALVEHTSLRAAMLWIPSRQPDGLRAFMKCVDMIPDGWTVAHHTARNTIHDGAIKMHHDVLILLPEEIAEWMEPSLKPPPGTAMSPMADTLDDNIGWVPDSLQLYNLDISKPMEVQRQAPGDDLDSPWACH